MMFLRAIMGPPLDTPLCGAERVRKLNERERERGVKKYGESGAKRERSASGAVSGYFDRSRSAHMLCGHEQYLGRHRHHAHQ